MEREPNRRERCPRCESTDTDPLRIAEHEACGAIKPARSFRVDGRVVCPDCGEECGDELEYVERGAPLRCRDCGHQFDADRSSVGPSEPAGDGRNGLDGGGADLLPVSGGGSTALSTAATVVVLMLVVCSSVVTAVGTAPLLEEETRTGDWGAYQSIVIFRNDDLQPYYETEAMRAVDRVFVEEEVPVTGGVIPAPGNLTLDRGMQACEYWRTQRSEHPDLFEYSLHGYHHDNVSGFYGSSEFGGVPADRQRAMIERGVGLFERCLGTTPDTFVPPLETYDDTTVEILAEHGFVGVSGGSWFADAYYNETGPFESDGLVHVSSSPGRFMKNWTTNEFNSERTMEAHFDAAYENGSVYVQMLHYQKFTSTERLEALRGLIEHMKSKERVAFVTLGEFSRKYANGRIRETDDGWEVWEADRKPPSAGTVVRRYVDSLRGLVPMATTRSTGWGGRA